MDGPDLQFGPLGATNGAARRRNRGDGQGGRALASRHDGGSRCSEAGYGDHRAVWLRRRARGGRGEGTTRATGMGPHRAPSRVGHGLGRATQPPRTAPRGRRRDARPDLSPDALSAPSTVACGGAFTLLNDIYVAMTFR